MTELENKISEIYNRYKIHIYYKELEKHYIQYVINNKHDFTKTNDMYILTLIQSMRQSDATEYIQNFSKDNSSLIIKELNSMKIDKQEEYIAFIAYQLMIGESELNKNNKDNKDNQIELWKKESIKLKKAMIWDGINNNQIPTPKILSKKLISELEIISPDTQITYLAKELINENLYFDSNKIYPDNPKSFTSKICKICNNKSNKYFGKKYRLLKACPLCLELKENFMKHDKCNIVCYCCVECFYEWL
jgi:hypothetical protein